MMKMLFQAGMFAFTLGILFGLLRPIVYVPTWHLAVLGVVVLAVMMQAHHDTVRKHWMGET